MKFYVCTRNVKNASFGGNGGQMPSGQEITMSCTLGDTHKRERAVLWADTACHICSVTSLGHVATDMYGKDNADIHCDVWYCSGG